MARPRWRLTVRHGSDVRRFEFGELDGALDAAAQRLAEIEAEGPLAAVNALRDYAPGDRVNARVEISGPGLWRPPTAGVDLMGDGRQVPYVGGVRRRELEPEPGATALDAVHDALREA